MGQCDTAVLWNRKKSKAKYSPYVDGSQKERLCVISGEITGLKEWFDTGF